MAEYTNALEVLRRLKELIHARLRRVEGPLVDLVDVCRENVDTHNVVASALDAQGHANAQSAHACRFHQK